jgi:hypothetical protein
MPEHAAAATATDPTTLLLLGVTTLLLLRIGFVLRSLAGSLADLIQSAACAADEAAASERKPPPELPAGARAFCRAWRVADTHNYEAYLVKLGLNWVTRKAIMNAPKFTVTYAIVDGVLHGDTNIPNAKHDIFHTDREVRLAMMGHDVGVHYKWEGDALVATMRGDQIAAGEPISVRRWVDDTGTLIAESSCDGVSYTRTYKPAEGGS